MDDRCYELAGARVYECAASGPLLRHDRDALDVVGAMIARQARWLALPVSRLGADFFDLRTRLAGELLQKFVNYAIHVAIVGDVGPYEAGSEAFAAFVRESNRGAQIWFVSDIAALEEKLAARRMPRS